MYAALSPTVRVLLWPGLGQQLSPLQPEFGRSAGLVGRSSAVQAAADAPGELVDKEARCGGINQVDGRVKPGGKAHDDADAQHQRGVAAVDGDLWPSNNAYVEVLRTVIGAVNDCLCCFWLQPFCTQAWHKSAQLCRCKREAAAWRR